MGGNFQRRGYCPEGNYLGAIVRGQLSSGELFIGNCPGSKSRGEGEGGNCLGGYFIGGNCPGGVF